MLKQIGKEWKKKGRKLHCRSPIPIANNMNIDQWHYNYNVLTPLNEKSSRKLKNDLRWVGRSGTTKFNY